jgi:polar amino acid transport system substrate-binding protein
MFKKSSKFASVAAGATLVIALAACAGPSAGSEDAPDVETLGAGILKVGTLSDAKPYAYIEDGELVGFEVDIATAIAEHIGLEPQFVQQEFSTLLPAVAAGTLDVAAASTSITEERLQNVDFSDTYFIGYITVIAPEGTDITDDYASLSGKRLGLMQGTLQDQYAQDNFPGVEVVRFPDNNAALAGMNSGSIDAVFLDAPIADDFTSADDTIERPIDIALPEYPVAMSMGKEKPKLQAAINEAIAEMISSGEWLEINNKYYPDQPVLDQFLPATSTPAAE